jgi:hypothetical protein
MSKRAFRLILVAYLAFETIASFYNAFLAIRVPVNIVGQLYSVFGSPVVPAPVGRVSVRRHVHRFIYFGACWAVFVLAECPSHFCCHASCIRGSRPIEAFLHHFWLG